MENKTNLVKFGMAAIERLESSVCVCMRAAAALLCQITETDVVLSFL